MRAAVVGGGLAGLAAGLELVDAGCEVTLYEARPTLGGAVQTLPARDGDPEPPPDNGQHIALGCFTEYLRFLDRIGEKASYLRLALELPVIAENGRTAPIGRSAASFLRYRHLSFRDRMHVANAVRHLPQTGPPDRTFGELLRELGCSDASIDRFWDVFVRPALNLPADEVSSEWGVFTVRTALLDPRSERRDPAGATARGDARRGGRSRASGGRCRRRDECAGRLSRGARRGCRRRRGPAGRVRATARGGRSRARAITDRQRPSALRSSAPRASARGAARERRALGVRQGPADRTHAGRRSPVPDGRIERGARARGDPRPRARRPDCRAARRAARARRASLVRVSREPEATLALRPGVRRPHVATERENVVRAGAWTDTGWPATMEGAVRSGRAAATHVLRSRQEAAA